MTRSLLGWLSPMQIFASLVVLFISLPVHSFMKAYTAKKLGDPTADLAGRMTLNPFAHINLWGALALVLFRFGWSNPLPIDSRNLKHPKRDMGIIAAVGPLTYLAMGFIFSLLGTIFYVSAALSTSSLARGLLITAELMAMVVSVNVQLGILHLLPFAPFDGGVILTALLPNHISYKVSQFFYRYQGIISVVLLIALYSGLLSTPLAWLSSKIATFFFDFFFFIIGALLKVFA